MVLLAHVLLAWLASTAFWFVLACLKSRKLPDNYHEACDLWGLCCWWPITITLELMLVRYHRKRRAQSEEA